MVIAFSCVEESITSQQDTALITEDALVDYYFEDADDLVGVALLADMAPNEGGREADTRVITLSDARFNCSVVVVTLIRDADSTPIQPKGNLVIDFGAGCTDAAGNVRKGRILVRFEGRRFMPGSKIVTTFENYSINEISIQGIRTLTNLTNSTLDNPKFTVELKNGLAKWPDNTLATREHCLVRTWIRATNPLNDAVMVEQCPGLNYAAKGLSKAGRNYTMEITEPMMYKRGCPIAVKGVKLFTDMATGKVLQVDYGDGGCDRTITLTIDGNSRKVEVKKRA